MLARAGGIVEPIKCCSHLVWSARNIRLLCVIPCVRRCQQVWAAGAPLTSDRNRAWPCWNTPSTHVTIPNLVALGQTCTGAPKICRTLGPRPLGWGLGWPCKHTRTPICTCVTLPSLGQTVRAQLRRSAWKFWLLVSRLSRSFKVTAIDTDRSATYDFLLVIHNNDWPTLYRFRDKRLLRSKIAKFSHSVYMPPLRGIGILYRR